MTNEKRPDSYTVPNAMLHRHDILIHSRILIHPAGSAPYHIRSILDVATLQAIHCTISKRLRDALRKLSDIGMVQEIRKS